MTLFAKTIAAAIATTRHMTILPFVPILAVPQLHPGPHPDARSASFEDEVGTN
jgi:hypothetical protein